MIDVAIGITLSQFSTVVNRVAYHRDFRSDGFTAVNDRIGVA